MALFRRNSAYSTNLWWWQLAAVAALVVFVFVLFKGSDLEDSHYSRIVNVADSIVKLAGKLLKVTFKALAAKINMLIGEAEKYNQKVSEMDDQVRQIAMRALSAHQSFLLKNIECKSHNANKWAKDAYVTMLCVKSLPDEERICNYFEADGKLTDQPTLHLTPDIMKQLEHKLAFEKVNQFAFEYYVYERNSFTEEVGDRIVSGAKAAYNTVKDAFNSFKGWLGLRRRRGLGEFIDNITYHWRAHTHVFEGDKIIHVELDYETITNHCILDKAAGENELNKQADQKQCVIKDVEDEKGNASCDFTLEHSHYDDLEEQKQD
eukprot:Nk52_evm15s234 gene=Nk52_evmTU15s234